jgi:hypothetical protein
MQRWKFSHAQSCRSSRTLVFQLKRRIRENKQTQWLYLPVLFPADTERQLRLMPAPRSKRFHLIWHGHRRGIFYLDEPPPRSRAARGRSYALKRLLDNVGGILTSIMRHTMVMKIGRLLTLVMASRTQACTYQVGVWNCNLDGWTEIK